MVNENRQVMKLDHITKTYQMYKKSSDRLKEALNPFKKQYHDTFYALNDVNIEVNEGEMVGFIGENGSGKSTLLKIITGVLTPSEGTIKIDGKISAILELGSGFNVEYTGYENIFLNGMVLGFSKEVMEEKLEDIIKFADIGEHLYQPVKTYSSGMLVRLGFAIAVTVDPDILIVDEALAVGDTEFQLKCMEKFTEFRQKGKTILFVSHDIHAVRRFCDRVYWLQKGKVIEEGETLPVTEKYDNYLKRKAAISLGHSIDEEVSTSVDYVSQIVTLDHARLYNSKRENTDEIQRDEFCYVRVDYTVIDDSIKDPVLGVAIRTVNNDYVMGPNTRYEGVKIPWVKGKNTFYIEYEQMFLGNGEYYFDVALFEQNAQVPFIYKSKAIKMFVVGKYDVEGLVGLPHRWTDHID
ncbi:ABC transporter ATP-binding protein [Enterococcus avium]|uniref:ABC transporter ATP-binding protein n=1 Tax=Enterococcus avium TaxID=33945 RepID=UPI002891708C|nr:ABC transporter ATP-binding protein [Enterococcus avium]MDT2437277.1 ABC transporter ATP-binding protein [Enterococcus avium]MDT2466291.1 ABC transporter ATP-binding protein [Enterococcus avium]MDT2505636.1 ABC transporter ATP-binding protein [Enterococcus avium]